MKIILSEKEVKIIIRDYKISLKIANETNEELILEDLVLNIYYCSPTLQKKYTEKVFETQAKTVIYRYAAGKNVYSEE